MIRALLTYKPETGELRWKRRGGAVAGCVDKLNGYVVVRVRGQLHRAHRLAWVLAHGRWPAAEIDHIDRNRANNALTNLRLATRSVNVRNSDRVASARGWSLTPDGTYRAGITRHGKRASRVFATAPEAEQWYRDQVSGANASAVRA